MCEKDILKAFPDVEENYCIIPLKTNALVAKITLPCSLSFSTQNMNELDLYTFQAGFLSNLSVIVFMANGSSDDLQLSIECWGSGYS